MINNLTSQEGLEILESLKNHEFIPVDLENIKNLEELGIIHGREPLDINGIIQIDLDEKKREYQEQLQRYDTLKEKFIQISKERDNSRYLSEFFYPFGFGKKRKMVKRLSSIMNQIRLEEEQLARLKKEILKMITLRDGELGSIQFKNKSYRITPKGISLIREIKIRPRFLNRNMEDLLKFLNLVDQNYQNQIDTVQSHITGRKFSPILVPYIADLDQLHLVPYFDRIGRKHNPYVDRIVPEERIIKKMVDELYDFPISPNFLKQTNKLYRIMKNIMNSFGSVPNEIRITMRLISYILLYWAYNQTRDDSKNLLKHPLILRFINNLNELERNYFGHSSSEEKSHYSDLKIGRYKKLHPLTSLFILALSDDPSKFSYFLPKVNHGLKGATFFASTLSIMPWTKEESWLLLKRAEKQVLMAQSVQFIPELLEYSIILNLNPKLLSSIGELSEVDLKYWKYVILPIIASIDIFSLNEEISNYVEKYPLSYITNPRPYYHYYGYYHRRTWYFWIGRLHRHYYRRYPTTTTYTTYHTGTRGGRMHSNRLISGTRGVGSVGRFGGGSRGSMRGSRYSSLHHHTIG
ncbi:MAG: hypothetical protein DRO88_12030 [Promethearchaeia archaeon]|nr:MAG: hypothetical protein DRO88_12030 [Candidatus Lokiarchaeia archaeon]